MKKYIFLLVLIINASINAQTPDENGIIYVDSKKYEEGSSWDKAFNNLSRALEAASGNSYIKEIWVAKGTYRPMGLSFWLPNNVKVYGGFDPDNGKVLLSQRSNFNETILTGNLNNKTKHVLIAYGADKKNMVLDGFKIIGGKAEGDGSIDVGGDNIYDRHGGALNIDRAQLLIRNCTFYDNYAEVRGGAIYATGSATSAGSTKLTILNCIFYNNRSKSNGSAISVNSDAQVDIINSTFYNNISNDSSYGGVIDKEGSGNQKINIYNSIIYDNYKGGVANTNNLVNITGGGSSNFPNIRYVIYNGPPITYNTTAVVPMNPNFVNTGSGNFNLAKNSIAINAGNDEYYKPFLYYNPNPNVDSNVDTDAYGFYRKIGDRIDIGATEYSDVRPSSTRDRIYVDKNGISQDGSSWFLAAKELADVLKWVNQNKEKFTPLNPLQIWVAKGTYKPLYTPEDGKGYTSTPTDNRDKTFLITDNVSLYGGFDGYEKLITRRNLQPKGLGTGTILSGDLQGDDIPDPDTAEGNNNANIADNAYHVVVAANKNESVKTVIDGFEIKGGNANGANQITVNEKFVNRASGGGIFSFSLDLLNSNIKNNSAFIGGGISGGSISVVNSSLNNNSSSDGGGIYSYTTSSLKNTSINNNYANQKGGGIYSNFNSNSNSNIILSNSTITNNSASKGGGIYTKANPIDLQSSTLAGNKGASYIYYEDTAKKNLYVHNSIIYGNENSIYGNINKDIKYSLVQGETTLENGNIDGATDPLFSNPTTGDFTLKPDSPLVNKGNNNLYKGTLTTDKDLNGNPRLYGDIIDIGAFELQSEATLSNEDLAYKTIKIYPNPVEDMLNIVGARDAETINVYNSTGQKIISQKFQSQINLKKLSSGLYILNIINKNGASATLKIIKK